MPDKAKRIAQFDLQIAMVLASDACVKVLAALPPTLANPKDGDRLYAALASEDGLEFRLTLREGLPTTVEVSVPARFDREVLARVQAVKPDEIPE